MTNNARIKEVYFERVFNLGNYETFRLGLHATVGPGQTAESVIMEYWDWTVPDDASREQGKDWYAVMVNFHC